VLGRILVDSVKPLRLALRDGTNERQSSCGRRGPEARTDSLGFDQTGTHRHRVKQQPERTDPGIFLCEIGLETEKFVEAKVGVDDETSQSGVLTVCSG